MSQRHFVQNEAMMFVTTNTYKSKPLFKNSAYAREAVESLYRVQELYPFYLYSFVIMPNHCHLLLRVPAPGSISSIMRSYKSAVVLNTGLQKIWQPRFFIVIPKKATEVIKYIHLNPVRAGIVEHIGGYPWSSASGKWDVTPIDSF